MRHKAWGRWRAQCWRNVERRKQEECFIPNVKVREKGKLLPFSAFFFFFMVFFFFVCFSPPYTWEEEDAKEKKLERQEIWGQKQKLEVRGQSESLKVTSFPSLHFFSSLWFFFLCFFPLLLRKKKMLRESVWKKRVEVGAKNEKVERELERKLLPFFWFFVLFFCVFWLLCVWEEEDNDNVLSSSFMVVF